MNTPSYYVDTSLIIARYKPSDDLYEDSNAFFKNDFNLVTSPITLVELYCVLSRVKNELDVPFKAEPLIDTLIEFIIKDCKLKLLSKSHFIKKDFAGYACRMSLEYYIATTLAGFLGLKTLDMLHLSYAWVLKKSFGISLFVTGDEEILGKAEAIRKSLSIKVYHPKQVIRAQEDSSNRRKLDGRSFKFNKLSSSRSTTHLSDTSVIIFSGVIQAPSIVLKSLYWSY